jgi:DNA replication protein DnaC
MEDYSKLWKDCLAMIREKYGDKFRNWFDVWFGDVRFESYDPDTHVLLIQVPSKYVYEYLEMNGAKDIRWATHEVFKDSITFKYRILREPTFAEVATYLQQQGYDSRKDPYHIRIDNARKRMEDGLHYFLKDQAQWLPGYDKIADWLADNKGRGLLCVGTTGRGKSLLCQQILPVILGNGGRPIASIAATDLKSRLDELLHEKIVIIDDLGKEPRKYFGNVDNSFFELCNNAERTGNLLIITTNLSTTPSDRALYPESIQERYGAEVLDRLKSITRMVRLEGESLRR